MGVRG